MGKPLTTGGLIGGLWGDGQVPASSESGDAYEGKFTGSVIMNGILYYQRTDTRRETGASNQAVDLHTGKESLFKNNTSTFIWSNFILEQLQLSTVYSHTSGTQIQG